LLRSDPWLWQHSPWLDSYSGMAINTAGFGSREDTQEWWSWEQGKQEKTR
jgi:hypothetical protein